MPPAAHDFNTSLERESFLRLRHLAAVSHSLAHGRPQLRSPGVSHRLPQRSDRHGEDSRDRLSPKAGVIWNPFGNLFVRGAYTQSLGGVSFDESVRLEPNQVAGFNQVFRSIISESVVGSVAAPTYDTAGS